MESGAAGLCNWAPASRSDLGAATPIRRIGVPGRPEVIAGKEPEMKQDRMPEGCCSEPGAASCHSCLSGVSRRGFLARSTAVAALAPQSVVVPRSASGAADGPRIRPIRRPLRVQPVFVYTNHERKEATSWRWTSEIYDEGVARDEE